MTAPGEMPGRRILIVCLAGVLASFIQVRVTVPRDPGAHAIASLWQVERSNVGDVLPSIRAAERIAQGLPIYTSVATSGASFIYPPIAALPYRPLVGLSGHEAGIWLFLANRALLLAIFLMALPLFRREGGKGGVGLRTALVLAGAMLLWHPLMRALELNQATVMVTAFIGASLLAMRSGREVLAGACLASAIAIKPPLILAVPLLSWHARRAALAALATGAGLLGLSVAYAGWAAHVEYLTRVLPSLSYGYVFYPNQSWNGLLGRMLHPEATNAFVLAPPDALIRIGSVLLGALTFLFFAFRIRRLPRDKDVRVDILGLAWLTATLSSPISWEHHYAPGLFCLFLLYQRLVSQPARWQGAPTQALAVAVVMMASYFETRQLHHPVALLSASHVFAGALLLAMIWSAALQRERPDQAQADVRPFFPWPPLIRRALFPLPSAAIARVEAIVLLACGLFTAYLLANLLLFQHGRDQGIYAVVARTVLEGGVPYRDAWDFKPPGIFFVYAVARLLFGSHMYGVRILEVLGLLSLVPAFAILSHRFLGSWLPAVLAMVLAVMAYVQLEFWNTGQPENFAAFLLAWVLVLATARMATAPDAPWWKHRFTWIAIGVLYGSAATLKPQLAGGALLTPLLIGWARTADVSSWHRRLRAGLAPLLFVGLGVAIPLLATVAYFASHGALSWMTETLFGFVPHYSRLGHEERGLLSLFAQGWDESLFRFSRHQAFGILLILFLPVMASPKVTTSLERQPQRLGLAHVLCVLFFPIMGVGLQAKFFPYHYGSIVPLLALPAAWGLWSLWLRLRSHLLPLVLLILVVLAFKDDRILPPCRSSLWDRNWVRIMAVFGEDSDHDRLMALLHSASDVNEEDNRQAAAWITRHTPPDASIYVWGFEPVIYELAHRTPSTRYIYNVPQRVPWSGEHRNQLLRDLDHRPPAVVVLEERDVFSHVTGNQQDSLKALSDFPELLRFLRADFLAGPRFGKLWLLVRR